MLVLRGAQIASHQIHGFDLERLHEAHGLGVGIAAPAHGAGETVLLQDGAIVFGGILRPTVPRTNRKPESAAIGSGARLGQQDEDVE
jgi:hypothetical protein